MGNKTEITLKWRAWYRGLPPRPIRLQIPGWAGDSHGHGDGDKPQPWHCPPFVEGSTYGLELVYPFTTECRVSNVDGKVLFEGDWQQEQPPEGVKFPPFLSFAPGHYGFTSSLDIKCDPDYVLRIEPHPRFYTDQTGTVPVTVAGHIQGDWWPKIFFVVFRSPRPGEIHIFRYGEPYAALLVLPRRVSYNIREMTEEEKSVRTRRDARLARFGKHLAKNCWKDHTGSGFDDKYKVLSGVYARDGEEGVDRLLADVEAKANTLASNKDAAVRRRLPRKLL